MLQWAADYLRFSAAAMWATAARTGGTTGERLLTGIVRRFAPRSALRVQAAYAEWRAMGWL
ncbi:hypothetical protein HC891_02100 [Candidatus Gracilibacteria bacterium]|nr:hypothetical protein [Candidatus Gracilibacteria bacterium]